jgi:solute carrier family 30 (zinc transporter), member 5/7
MPLLSFAAIPLLAYSLLFLYPGTLHSMRNMSFGSQYFTLSYPLTFVLACVMSLSTFSQPPTWTDFVVCGLVYYGMQILFVGLAAIKFSLAGMYPEGFALSRRPSTPTSRLIRQYLKTILSNPESRKIFYFLILNMCYMLVQMLYGVWTNSLGLISDGMSW